MCSLTSFSLDPLHTKKVLSIFFDYHEPSRNKANFESIFKSIQSSGGSRGEEEEMTEEKMSDRASKFTDSRTSRHSAHVQS